MRCYFMAGGHVQTVETLIESSDDEAIATAFTLFRRHGERFEGFELWDRARLVHRYLPAEAVAESSEREFLAYIVNRLLEIANNQPGAAAELRLLVAELQSHAAEMLPASSASTEHGSGSVGGPT